MTHGSTLFPLWQSEIVLDRAEFKSVVKKFYEPGNGVICWWGGRVKERIYGQ